MSAVLHATVRSSKTIRRAVYGKDPPELVLWLIRLAPTWDPKMRVFLRIVAMTILLAPVAASAHGNDGKGECHRHKGERTYHCHP
jgi:hypothetical protein